jgi:hypothetical protein
MRLVLATKREIDMSERTLLFLMNAEQTETFVRLLGAAERGDGVAACQLGDMYRVGEGGLRYSPKEAFRWYAKSALTGDANGQCNLGACYEHGLGCTQSYVKAVKWYRLSAAQRLGTASMNLAYCLLRGHGVPANRGEALRLFRVAVEQGEPRAADELERLGERIEVAEVWEKQGIRFVDETKSGKHFGVVGVGGVLSGDDADGREATEEELFPIYAECGMSPSDFAPETAERYADYLADREGEPA